MSLTNPCRRGLLLLGAAGSLFFLSPGAVAPTLAKPVEAEWTLMFFMDSDNNLELPQMANIMAAARVGSSEDVRIVALVDRSDKSDEGGGFTDMDVLNVKNWVGGKIFEVEKGSLKEIENLGDINMGDPNLLVSFVDKAVAIAPAQKYCLIFGDHGASWPGFNSDGSHEDDSLSLTELDGALKTITGKLGRLEMIHYDDCLMSCVENATAVAPYTKWLTASAELVPGDGCDYDAFLAGLEESPSMDGKALGTLLVKTFNDFYTKTTDEGRKNAAPTITMALIDCDKVAELNASLADLGSKAASLMKSEGREAFLKTAGARAKSTEYGREGADEPGAGVVDIVDFCRLLQKEYGPGPVGTAAEETIGKLKAAVVTNIHGSALPQSRGMSIYMPTDAGSLSGPGNTYSKTKFAAESGWDKLAAEFNHVRLEDKSDPDLQPVKASANQIKPDGEVTFTSSLKADDLDEAYFTLSMPDGDDRIIMGQIPTSVEESGNLKESWDGKWLYMHNGKEMLICPIEDIQLVDDDKPDADLLAIVPIQVRRGGKGDWIDLTASFLLDFSDEEAVSGDLIYAFEDSKAGMREVELKKGDQIRPVFLVVNKDGDEEYVPAEGKEFELDIEEADGLSVVEDRVPDGDYLMGFRAVDLSGNAAEDFTAVKVIPTEGTFLIHALEKFGLF